MVQQTLMRVHYERCEYRQDGGVAGVDLIDWQKIDDDNKEPDSLSSPHTEYRKAYDTCDILLKHLSRVIISLCKFGICCLVEYLLGK
jgi:hypothetical protein